MLAALLAAFVAAAPESPAPAPAGAPEAAETKPKVVKLAAPGLEAVDVDPKKAQFLNDYLAEQVGRRSEARIQVITQSEVAALIGLERTKSLLGCKEDSSECLTEIADALGADGIIVGNLAKFGDTYAMTIKVLGSDSKARFSASNTGMTEPQVVEWVKTTSIDLVKRLDPGASAAGPTSVGPEKVLPEDKWSLWLSPLLGAELERRLNGPSWVGVRVAGSAGKVIASPGFSGNLQVLAMARYMPLRPGEKFVWSVYTGLGVGFVSGPVEREHQTGPFAATLGAEVGYQSLRFSTEVMYSSGWFTVIPGLSIALTF